MKYLCKGERCNWINGWTMDGLKVWRKRLEWNLHYLTEFISSFESSHCSFSSLSLRVPPVTTALEVKMGADLEFSGSHTLESRSEQLKFTTSWISNNEENQTTQQEKMSRGFILVCFNWLTVNLHGLELCLQAEFFK